METGKRMSIRDVLEIVVNRLGNINVPVMFRKQISDPIEDVRNQLIECIIAIDKSQKEGENNVHDDDGNGADEASDGEETDGEDVLPG